MHHCCGLRPGRDTSRKVNLNSPGDTCLQQPELHASRVKGTISSVQRDVSSQSDINGPSSGSSEASSSTQVSLEVCKLNSSIYGLHKPSDPARVQVVLFHGLQREDYVDAHLKT